MSPSLWKNRILVVDDDPVISAMIQQALTNREYECVMVSNGVHAWQAIKSKRPDAIVTDLMMPAASGFVLLRQVKSDPELRRIPVILMTATGNEQIRAEAIRLGAGAYFAKPFHLDELAATLQRLIKGEPAPQPVKVVPPADAGDGGMVMP